MGNIQETALAAQEACPVAGGAVSLIRAREINDAIQRANTAVARLDEILALLTDEAGLQNIQQAQSEYQQLLQSGSLNSTTASGEQLLGRMQGYLNDCN